MSLSDPSDGQTNESELRWRDRVLDGCLEVAVTIIVVYVIFQLSKILALIFS